MATDVTTAPDPLIHVVGLHGGRAFGSHAEQAVADAAVIVAAPRHRTAIELTDAPRTIELSGPLQAVLDQVADAVGRGQAVTILASGDPGFFGIVRVLHQRFGAHALQVHPAPSSVALAFGRIGTTWDDATVVSAHGRPPEAAIHAVQGRPKVAVLTSPQTPPEELGRLLLAASCAARDVAVATRLGEPDEAVTRTDLPGLTAGTFDPMSVVIFLDPAANEPAAASLSWGMAEDEFAHRGGLITKSEVRAVALGKLDLPSHGVVWDVGAGSGSVGIECARLRPGLRVVAVERNADDADRIRTNAERHGVTIEIVQGSAPTAFADLPDPDRVFVGGGGMDALQGAWERLTPGGTLVATHVLVDRAAAAWSLLGNTVQIAASRAVPIADGFRLDAQNPVFVSWARR